MTAVDSDVDYTCNGTEFNPVKIPSHQQKLLSNMDKGF